MKSITTQEMLRLTQATDPQSILEKMSYAEITALKEELEKTISLVHDSRLSSILLEFKDHVVICEKQLRQKELERIKSLSTLDEIISYIAEIEKKEMIIYA